MTRPADARLIWIPLQRRSGHSLQKQICTALREAVRHGRLSSGSRLPATRTLAADLGVSRNTVLQAFEQLVAEGILRSVRGAGTFVDSALAPKSRRRRDASHPLDTSPGRCIARRSEFLRGLKPWLLAPPLSPVPFAVGQPDVRRFARAVWVRLTNRVLRQDATLMQYGQVQGHAGLRSALTDYLGTARGVRCEADDILIVNGSQQALDLIARVLIDPGDEAWIEDPGYFGALLSLQAAGARITPVPVDAEGLRLAEVGGESIAPRLIYVTPASHFPLGTSLSMERRRELLALASERGSWIVEDDYDSEFRYTGPPLPALRSLDREGRVLYVGTFSKTLAPALRLGYLVLPRDLVSVFTNLRFVDGQHAPALEQAVMAEFLREGHFASHVARTRRLYRGRRALLLEELRVRLPAGFEVSAPEGGLHVLVHLPEGADDLPLVRMGETRGLDLTPLSKFCLLPRARKALLLGFAALEEEAIRSGVQRLCALLGESSR